MPDSHKNFAASLVATAPSPATSGTSLVVTATEGAIFPTVPFNAVVWPAGAQPTTTNAEIVRVTTISTDTFTITRTQESTSARSIVVGDQIAATITNKTLTDAENSIATDSIWAAAGDIVQATGADAAAVLTIGSAFRQPRVNSGATALEYAGGFSTISDSTLAASAANFDLTSISGSYAHLMLVGYLRTDRVSANQVDGIAVRFNNDSAANYDDQYDETGNTTVSGSVDLAATKIAPWSVCAASAEANKFTPWVAWIPHYAGSSNQKVIIGFSGAIPSTAATTNFFLDVAHGLWRSTAAITRITVLPNGGTNWRTGSRLTLYGMSV